MSEVQPKQDINRTYANLSWQTATVAALTDLIAKGQAGPRPGGPVSVLTQQGWVVISYDR